MTGSSNTSPHVLSVFRDFRSNPPVRPLHGGKVGGVAAAIGKHYGIDPILARVGFALTTLYGGAGVLLYLLGWLMLPKEGGSGQRNTSGAAAVVLVLLMIPALFMTTSLSGLLSLAGGLGAIYLLHYNRSRTAAGAPETFHSGATTTGGVDGFDAGQDQPPSWDPLGAAPFAWDLPDPSPEPESEPEPARPKRRWITVVWTLLVLGVGLGTIAWGAAIPTALAISLGLLGIGMVIGAFLHGGRGLIGVAIPVGAAAMLMSVLPVQGPWEGVGQTEATPTTVEALQERYALSVGSIELDLRHLPPGQTAHTSTSLDLGSTVVHIPREADLIANCHAEYGQVDCLQGESAQDGSDVSQHVNDFGPDGPGGGNIKLDLAVGAGDVEVIRG